MPAFLTGLVIALLLIGGSVVALDIMQQPATEMSPQHSVRVHG